MSPLFQAAARSATSVRASSTTGGRRGAGMGDLGFRKMGCGRPGARRVRPLRRPAGGGPGRVAGMDIGEVTQEKIESRPRLVSSGSTGRRDGGDTRRHHQLATLSADRYLELDPAGTGELS